MQKSIYITYNPNSPKEQELANDLYFKGRKNGFIVNLPSRNNRSLKLSYQTKLNIDSSDWFLVFSIDAFSDTLMEEINYAASRKKSNQIIVVYSSHKGRNINFDKSLQPIEIYVDNYDINRIEEFKNDVFNRISANNKSENKSNNGALGTIIGIGATILLLRELFKESNR